MSACNKGESKFPDEPVIELKGTMVGGNFAKDTVAIISLGYTDGDGDIGLQDGDSAAPFNYGSEYFYNLWVWYYAKINGQWTKVKNPISPTNDTINFHERLPVITPKGRNKWISGQLDLMVPAYPFGLNYDTVRYSLQLVDRKLRKSNLIFTEPFVFRN